MSFVWRRIIYFHIQVHYKISVDGEEKQSKINEDPREFRNVQLFASDYWHDSADAVYKNLCYENVETEEKEVGCPYGWKENSGFCYKYFPNYVMWNHLQNSSTTWEIATQTCSAMDVSIRLGFTLQALKGIILGISTWGHIRDTELLHKISCKQRHLAWRKKKMWWMSFWMDWGHSMVLWTNDSRWLQPSHRWKLSPAALLRLLEECRLWSKQSFCLSKRDDSSLNLWFYLNIYWNTFTKQHAAHLSHNSFITSIHITQ